MAGESDPEDFPIAARTYDVLKGTYNFELDIHKLAQDIQGNSRAAALQEMTRVSQLVTFLMKFGDVILQCDTSGLPTRPPPACRAVSLPLGSSLRPCSTSTDSHGTQSTRR